MIFPVNAGFKPLNLTPDGPEFKKPVPTVRPQAVIKKAVKKDPPKARISNDGQNYGVGEIQDLIRKYSQQYGISSETPLCIAKKESGFNPNAKNKSSSASGVFQYLSGTWRDTDEGKLGMSVFNAESNIKAAVKYMGVHRSTKPWVAAKQCPMLTFL